MKDFYKQILNDVAVELTDEFDRNFERRAFFDKKWRQTKLINRRGSILQRSGRYRRSIQSRVGSHTVHWVSSAPYSSIQNEGGEIIVTDRMKKYFWAMYIRAGKTGIEAEQFKAMALKPVGSKITIPERRVIGDHPEVKRAIERCADATFKEIEEFLKNQLKQR
ncbi:hypothetical protein EIB75_10700 [Epilithonimonas vandammei]|uniref:Phage morphogenesis protein n=1 Tax=Epilithonimonas vandammei TaxID=2487072 RepID=A0A3G8ZA54_9FLAO|nr:phage virion morphogenesis protein [Epilithonimonas vandammei]AZI53890.1 hypothetical protein EIB75_00850 [Epilithonimonas vandammei]AZI55691.1 hypothetical protein EIB75_10700 [Epilithonimonas vandammei]